MDNILDLHKELKAKSYVHGGYHAFNINDPKPRSIHKASVRDRLLHHALYRTLYPFFDRTFIADSFSCRMGKGTHRAIDRFKYFAGKASRGNTRTCWVLKCDIRKFFASIDQSILEAMLSRYILDKDILSLLRAVISSFHSSDRGIGLPLGNLTSQLFVNIYMNEFDQFMKHKMRAKYYIRYADDFVILSPDKSVLVSLAAEIGYFLAAKLKLNLHPDKVFIKTLPSGLDFLGWVHFTDHRVLRTTTRKRQFRNTRGKGTASPTVQSCLGMMKHGNAYKIRVMVESRAALLAEEGR